jgi:hypothetical protein
VTPAGNGSFTPAFGPNQVFIPYDVQGTVTADGVVVDEFHDVKPARCQQKPARAGSQRHSNKTARKSRSSGTVIVMPRGPKG